MPKRKLSTSIGSVSPPTVRRKVSSSSTCEGVNNTSQQSSAIRIFSWNVNGVKPLMQKELSFKPNTIFPLRAFLKRHLWPQFLCLQEVKISLKDFQTQKQLLHAANAGGLPSEPVYVSHFSLPRDKYNATGFGGKVHGVASLIRSDFEKHLKATWLPDWDLEGRVLVHEFSIESSVCAVVNGYWVNGTTNPYRSPLTGNVVGTRHDHKLHFHQHMLELVQRLENEGSHVVLIGDMNVARSSLDGHPNLRSSPLQHVQNRTDFNSKFFTDDSGLQGIDVFRQLHGTKKKYTYHPRGCGWGQNCDRVDNIIVTRGLWDLGAVCGTDICDNPGDRGHSDHVPLWVEIDLSVRFADAVDKTGLPGVLSHDQNQSHVS